MSDAPPVLDLPHRFGSYDLVSHLATGGMADIFLARLSGEGGFQKLVVIKRLLEAVAEQPEFVEMFLDEARINARLSHSNVVQCHDLGRVDGRYFMAMEYLPGLALSLIARVATQRTGGVPLEVAAGVIAQACTGVHYAHERTLSDGTPLGIVHRDISPQNLILTTEGVVKVVDFGIAKARGRATQTRAGTIKGKFAYMSPEQCTGEPVDRRADVFALGIVLFELATGMRLFKRATTPETFQAVARCEVPDPHNVNPAIKPPLAEVIRKALTRRAADRFQTADDLQEALEAAMRKSGLRGDKAALAAFLERTFPDELAAQRQVAALALEGQVVTISVGDVAGASTEANDDPTSQYTPEPLEMEIAVEAPTAADAEATEVSSRTPEAEEDARASAPSSPPVIAASAETVAPRSPRRSRVAPIVALVLTLLAAAAAVLIYRR